MGRPGFSITSDNLGPAVNLAAWICLVVMSLTVLAKVISKLLRAGKAIGLSMLQADDWFLIVAMVKTLLQILPGVKRSEAQQYDIGIHRRPRNRSLSTGTWRDRTTY